MGRTTTTTTLKQLVALMATPKAKRGAIFFLGLKFFWDNELQFIVLTMVSKTNTIQLEPDIAGVT